MKMEIIPEANNSITVKVPTGADPDSFVFAHSLSTTMSFRS